TCTIPATTRHGWRETWPGCGVICAVAAAARASATYRRKPARCAKHWSAIPASSVAVNHVPGPGWWTWARPPPTPTPASPIPPRRLPGLRGPAVRRARGPQPPAVQVQLDPLAGRPGGRGRVDAALVPDPAGGAVFTDGVLLLRLSGAACQRHLHGVLERQCGG